MDELKEIKKLVIHNLLGQFDEEEKKEVAKEFGLPVEKLNDLIVKLADKWLSNPDHVIMIASVLGISVPRKAAKDRSSRYIG